MQWYAHTVKKAGWKRVKFCKPPFCRWSRVRGLLVWKFRTFSSRFWSIWDSKLPLTVKDVCVMDWWPVKGALQSLQDKWVLNPVRMNTRTARVQTHSQGPTPDTERPTSPAEMWPKYPPSSFLARWAGFRHLPARMSDRLWARCQLSLPALPSPDVLVSLPLVSHQQWGTPKVFVSQDLCRIIKRRTGRTICSTRHMLGSV